MSQGTRKLLVIILAVLAAVCKIVSYQLYSAHQANNPEVSVLIDGVRYIKETPPYDLPFDLLATASLMLILSCFLLTVRPTRINRISEEKAVFRVILSMELFDWAKEVTGLNNLNDGSQMAIFLMVVFSTTIYSIYEYRYYKRND